MVVPGRVEAASVLLELDPPGWFLRHSRGVAEVAAFLAARAAARGFPVDVRLVEVGALLHDVDKLLPADDSARRLPHGQGSAAWLARHGYPELAPVAEWHPVTRLLGPGSAAGPPDVEAKIVAYADKRVAQRLAPIEARFRGWRRRYPRSWSSMEGRLARARARRLEREVCAAAGVSPAQVRRLRWVGAAVETARRRGETGRREKAG